MEILELLSKIGGDLHCKVECSKGLPDLSEGHILPDDLREFYFNCGGLSLFTNESYGFFVLTPEEFVLANPIIVGELCEEDISSEWYTICKDLEGNFLTIDLNSSRLGKCYDSFWDRHGVVGECAVIANNFSELLSSLYYSEGKKLYWIDDDFQELGDAYDE